ncbi:MAG: hypothetical protein R3E88_07660 [Myxococcota bacterium]
MRAPRSSGAPVALLLLTLAALVAADARGASTDGAAVPAPPPLPQGDGVVTGAVLRAGAADGAPGLPGVPVVLYGLSQTGEPGVADTVTDASGRFRFENVSSEPTMAYLVGAKYGGIPFFGPSVRFTEGVRALEANVEVTEPTADASGIAVDEAIVELQWTGGKLAVQELHRLESAGGRVVLVPEDARDGRTPAPFETALPAGASDFLPMTAGFEDALVRSGERVRFYGPVYPRGQDVRFQYLLPIDGERTRVALAFPMGARHLRVLTAVGGPDVAGAPPLARGEDADVDGRRYRVLEASDVAKGARIALDVSLPATDADATRLSLPRADLWLELDDTQLVANASLALEVAGAHRLASVGDAPLARFALPAEAADVEIPPDARALGASVDGSAIVVRGPLPPGESTLRARFRVPATPEGARLDIAFPLEVATLNVLVADTGVDIESDRLHRRRPFRQGTRTYLHREAFHVEPAETLALGLAPIRRGGLGSRGAAVGVLGLVAAAVWYLMAPLRAERANEADESLATSAAQREAIYQDIRDLDHDFETGKLDEDDHRALRAQLLARAAASIELERRDAADATDAAEAANDASAPTSAARTPTARDGVRTAPAPHAADGTGRPVPLGAFCPRCGGRIDASWAFCSHCGAALGAERTPGAREA